MSIHATDLITLTERITKEWTKQRKAEERGTRERGSRRHMFSARVSHMDVADEILPAAYLHASGGGQYWVKMRQLYYAARKQFQKLTGRPIDAKYFSQQLLRKYMNQRSETESWKIAADARGHLIIPNAGYDVTVPIGTLEIAAHLREAARTFNHADIRAEIQIPWPSIGAGQRYQAVLYIEKEGFGPLLDEARIAERFDIAILSGKGQSTAAARRFVDEVCRILGGVPLFILRDFDKAGFQIAIRLTTVGAWAEESDMVLYEFKNDINVTDFGLRLADVEEYGLHDAAEDVPCNCYRCKCFRCQPLDQEEYGVTDDEYQFLVAGRRVELNALTSPQFIQLIENKLRAHGLSERLIPEDAVLEQAYRRALAIARLNSVIDREVDAAIEAFSETAMPETLRQDLRERMKDSAHTWDQALYGIAQTKVRAEDTN